MINKNGSDVCFTKVSFFDNKIEQGTMPDFNYEPLIPSPLIFKNIKNKIRGSSLPERGGCFVVG